MTTLLIRYPFATFSLATVLLSLGAYLLPIPREGVPVIMVFVPALVAVAVAALTTGATGVRALLGKLGHWRLRLSWVLGAILLGLGLRLVIGGVSVVLGITETVQVRPGGPALAILAVVLFVFAVPEELGWRGFALPLLLRRQSPLAASLIIGVLWGALHLALHLPGMMYAELPALSTLPLMMSLSVLLTWVYLWSESNVIIASLFHAAQSFFVILNEDIPPVQQAWLMAGVYVAVAVMLAVVSRGLGQRLAPLQSVASPPG